MNAFQSFCWSIAEQERDTVDAHSYYDLLVDLGNYDSEIMGTGRPLSISAAWANYHDSPEFQKDVEWFYEKAAEILKDMICDKAISAAELRQCISCKELVPFESMEALGDSSYCADCAEEARQDNPPFQD